MKKTTEKKLWLHAVLTNKRTFLCYWTHTVLFGKSGRTINFRFTEKGELKEALVRYAEQLGISEAVKFHGFSSEIHKIMAGSAIYVSSSDYEGISNSMLEALAIGIPAVCTDCPVGGARMYIRDGENGYLIPVGDADVMADRMLALMEDKKLGESFSKESVKIREELTDDRIFGMWKALLVR